MGGPRQTMRGTVASDAQLKNKTKTWKTDRIRYVLGTDKEVI